MSEAKRAAIFTPAVVREAERQRDLTGQCPLCGATDEQRAKHDPRAEQLPKRIGGPDDVLRYATAHGLTRAKREHFAVLLLDARHGVIGWETISIGSLNASLVHPREVFRAAMLAAAASVILVHNHPSGAIDPSEDDEAITRRLREVGELVGIEVVDHVIVAGNLAHSMREHHEGGL